VHIYRLLTTGTIDEKIWQRQLVKQVGTSHPTASPLSAHPIALPLLAHRIASHPSCRHTASHCPC
jgi:hypothetical protein